MPDVAVVTDSCASIPPAVMTALDIHWVPYYVHRGQEVLRDWVSVHGAEFYAWLETAAFLPTTAAPGPGDYLELYRRLADAGRRDIVSLHMTSKGSAAYQSAVIGAEMLQETQPAVRVAVVDTLNVSMCTGWLVIEAARAARAGQPLDAILARVARQIPRTRMLQTADTLRYLYLGGRIGRAAHLVGSLLSIKPIISMEAGEIVPLGRARSRAKAYQMMVALLEQAVGPGGQIRIAYTHAAALEEVAALRELVEARLTCVETLVAELSPALGVHTGPGTAGLCYLPVDAEADEL